MDMNNDKNSFSFEIPTTVQTVFCDKMLTAEIGQDFVLPDYQPEMRKLLRITPSILPPSRFLGVGEAEFAGNVAFAVLYIGADGALYTAELTTPYTFRIALEESDRSVGDRPIAMHAELIADAVIPRLQAPRKLQIKCRLRAHIIGRGDEDTGMKTANDHTERETERLERTCLCARTVYGMGEAFEVTDEIAVPAGEGEVRVIDSRGTVQITEANLSENGLICRGELHWQSLFTRDRIPQIAQDGEEIASTAENSAAGIEILTRRIPFSHTIDLPLSHSFHGWNAMAYGTCTDVNTRVEDGKLLCAATIVPEGVAIGNEKVTFTCDCFSTVRQSECDMHTFRYDRAVTCLNGNVTAGGSLPIAELGIPHNAIPTDLSACAAIQSVSCERGRLILNGECTYQLLYQTPEGEFATTEFHLPLRYEIPDEGGHTADAAYLADARAVMTDGRTRLEGENLTVDAEWVIAACITAQEEIESVSELHNGAILPARNGAYILCYPDNTETLWNIAKRYHSALRPLVMLNELPGSADPDTPQSLDGIRFLMIG